MRAVLREGLPPCWHTEKVRDIRPEDGPLALGGRAV